MSYTIQRFQRASRMNPISALSLRTTPMLDNPDFYPCQFVHSAYGLSGMGKQSLHGGSYSSCRSGFNSKSVEEKPSFQPTPSYSSSMSPSTADGLCVTNPWSVLPLSNSSWDSLKLDTMQFPMTYSSTGNEHRSQQRHHATASSRRKRKSTPTQRVAANIRERRRMCSLNAAFDRLRRRVPAFPHEKKLSRIQTLRLAIKYILFMSETIAAAEQSDAAAADGPVVMETDGMVWSTGGFDLMTSTTNAFVGGGGPCVADFVPEFC